MFWLPGVGCHTIHDVSPLVSLILDVPVSGICVQDTILQVLVHYEHNNTTFVSDLAKNR